MGVDFKDGVYFINGFDPSFLLCPNDRGTGTKNDH